MYQVYIVSTDDVILLPTAPSYIDIKINDKDTRINLINKGEVNVLKKPGLTEIEFDIRLYKQEYPFTQYLDGFKEPGYFIKKLLKIKENKEYCRLIVIREMPGFDIFDTNLLVSIKDLSIPEKANDGSGDFNITIQMLQYKHYGTRVLKLKQIGDKKVLVREKEERPSKKKSNEIIVKEGQTLWSIAKKELNDERQVENIMKLNNLNSYKDIKPGQKLKLR